jgi:hypothetical protein
VGGARNAPRGQMFAQAISRTRARTPMLGGNTCTLILLLFDCISILAILFYSLVLILLGSFAVWGTLFSCCDCSLTAIRKKVSFPNLL